MCLKEVDLSARRKCRPEELLDPEGRELKQSPSHPSESRSTKDVWRSITEKERREYRFENSVDCKAFFDWRRAGNSKEGLRNQQQETLMAKLYSTKYLSVGGSCLQFASAFYYIFANCDTKVLSSAVQKLIFILLLFDTVCCADGTGDSFLGNGLTPFIELNGKVPLFSHAKWMCGQKTVKNVTDKQNLIISHQNMTNCICEIRDPNRSDLVLHQYPMQVFNSCAIVEDQDFDAFKRGKKFIQVELEGEVAGSDSGNVSQLYYSFCIKNDTMEISPEEGSGHQLELASVRCNVKYINFEMNPPINERTGQVLDNRTTNSTEKVCNDLSNMVMGIFIGAGGVCVILMCLLATRHIIKRRRNKAPMKERSMDVEAADAKNSISSSDKLLANQDRVGCISAV